MYSKLNKRQPETAFRLPEKILRIIVNSDRKQTRRRAVGSINNTTMRANDVWFWYELTIKRT